LKVRPHLLNLNLSWPNTYLSPHLILSSTATWPRSGPQSGSRVWPNVGHFINGTFAHWQSVATRSQPIRSAHVFHCCIRSSPIKAANAAGTITHNRADHQWSCRSLKRTLVFMDFLLDRRRLKMQQRVNGSDGDPLRIAGWEG